MIEPRYRQIANDLRLKIDAGRWMPGERLPTELGEIPDHRSIAAPSASAE